MENTKGSEIEKNSTAIKDENVNSIDLKSEYESQTGSKTEDIPLPSSPEQLHTASSTSESVSISQYLRKLAHGEGVIGQSQSLIDLKSEYESRIGSKQPVERKSEFETIGHFELPSNDNIAEIPLPSTPEQPQPTSETSMSISEYLAKLAQGESVHSLTTGNKQITDRKYETETTFEFKSKFRNNDDDDDPSSASSSCEMATDEFDDNICFDDSLAVKKIELTSNDIDKLKPWICEKIAELLGKKKNDRLAKFVINQLEGLEHPDPRKIHINLVGYLGGKKSRIFMGELWKRIDDDENFSYEIDNQFHENLREENDFFTKKNTTNYLQKWLAQYDGELPEEILSKCDANQCRLCNVSFNEIQNSKNTSKVDTSRYKTTMCRSFSQSGSCRYGKKCQFAHGEYELQPVQQKVVKPSSSLIENENHYSGRWHQKNVNFALNEWKSVDPINRKIPIKKKNSIDPESESRTGSKQTADGKAKRVRKKSSMPATESPVLTKKPKLISDINEESDDRFFSYFNEGYQQNLGNSDSHNKTSSSDKSETSVGVENSIYSKPEFESRTGSEQKDDPMNSDEIVDTTKCRFCETTFASELAAHWHYKGENHIRNVQKLSSESCTNTASYNSIIAAKSNFESQTGNKQTADRKSESKVVSDEVSTSELLQKKKNSIDPNSELRTGSKQTTNQYYCEICKVDCQVALDYKAHLIGKKHRKNAGH